MTAKQLLEETLVVTNRLMEQIAAVKKRTIVVIIVVLIAWFFRQQSVDHSEEIRNIRDSVSNMYRDFEPAMFTDLEGVKSMIAKIRKFAEEDLSKAEEIQMKTQTLESKIVTLQNFKFDQTGRADLALSSIGGRIAGIGPDTQPFYSCNFIWRSLGCPNKVNGPEKIIDPSMQPGDCFRFKSKNATVFIRLAHEAILDAVTIEHITQKISLTGDVSEAPRKFSVSGINKEHDEPFHFGTFDFKANKSSIETFPFRNRAPTTHKYVKVNFHENNGHPNETCVYRLRIHGVATKSELI